MTTAVPAAGSGLLPPPPDFSLVLGGPLYQLMRGARLAGDTLQLLRRRIVVLATRSGADLPRIALAQSLRVFVLVALLPWLIPAQGEAGPAPIQTAKAWRRAWP